MGIFSQKLGIDLGTTSVLVYLPGKGIVLNEPSVVAISEEDKRILAIGNDAKKMIGKTPESIVAYRPMKDGVIADYRVTEAMLRYYIGKALGKWNIAKPEVLISVPAGVTSTERRAVIEAAIKAGAKSAYVVKEPILAAIGGGIVSSTSVKCAGNRIDSAIADYIKKTFNLAVGDKTAEEIKMKIGSAIPLDEELVMTIKGRDYVLGLPRSVEIKTNEIVKAIGRELREIVKAIKDVLQETPPELSSDIIDRGIIMTGGSSQLRNLPELIFRRVGVKTTLAENPLYCVAQGTGIALEHLSAYKRMVVAKR